MLTAPIIFAVSDNSSRYGITCFLYGMVTFSPPKLSILKISLISEIESISKFSYVKYENSSLAENLLARIF